MFCYVKQHHKFTYIIYIYASVYTIFVHFTHSLHIYVHGSVELPICFYE